MAVEETGVEWRRGDRAIGTLEFFGMKAKRYKVLCRALRVNMPDF
jgi:hypothetical protein